MNKSKKSVRSSRAAPSVKRQRPTTCAQPVNIRTALNYAPSVGDLFAGIDPVVRMVVNRCLETPTESDRFMLDAWDKCGRRDARRNAQPYATHTLTRTMTPLGIACLIRYAQGWEDERQAMAAELPA